MGGLLSRDFCSPRPLSVPPPGHRCKRAPSHLADILCNQDIPRFEYRSIVLLSDHEHSQSHYINVIMTGTFASALSFPGHSRPAITLVWNRAVVEKDMLDIAISFATPIVPNDRTFRVSVASIQWSLGMKYTAKFLDSRHYKRMKTRRDGSSMRPRRGEKGRGPSGSLSIIFLASGSPKHKPEKGNGSSEWLSSSSSSAHPPARPPSLAVSSLMTLSHSF